MKIFKKYMLISLTLTLSMLTGCPHDQDSIINIETQDSLQSLLTKSQGPIVISLQIKKNCDECKQMEPIIHNVATDPRCNDICFYRADVQNLKTPQDKPSVGIPNLVQQAIGQNIPSYPFLLFMDQGKFIDKQIGVTTQEDLMKKIQVAFPNAINHNPNDKSCCDHN